MSSTPWRQPFGGGGLRGNPTATTLVWTGVAVLSCAAVALLVQRFDTTFVLVGLLCALALTPLVLWPELATVTCVFLLYTNVPVIAGRHGVPVAVASAFIGLLGLPLLQLLIVRRQRMKADTTFFLMIGFLVVLVASAIGAREPDLAEERIVVHIVEGLLLYWLIINVVRTLPTLRRVIWTLLAAGSMLGAMTLVQELTGNYKMQFGGLVQRNTEYAELTRLAAEGVTGEEIAEALAVKTGRSTRPGGPVSQSNRFAQILIVLVPLAVYMQRTERRRAGRNAALVAAALITAGVLLTLSRSAFLILASLAVAMVFLRWVRLSHLLVAGFALIMCASLVVPSFFERIASIASAVNVLSSDVADRSKTDGAVRGRTTSMMTAWLVFRDHPFLGVGAGQYQQYVLEYVRRIDNAPRDHTTARRAHNLYLELLAEVGVIGLAVFLWIIGSLIRRLFQRRRELLAKYPASADLATACGLMLLVYLGTGMFAHLSFQRYYWFALALAGAALHVLRAQHGAADSDDVHGDRPVMAVARIG